MNFIKSYIQNPFNSPLKMAVNVLSIGTTLSVPLVYHFCGWYRKFYYTKIAYQLTPEDLELKRQQRELGHANADAEFMKQVKHHLDEFHNETREKFHPNDHEIRRRKKDSITHARRFATWIKDSSLKADAFNMINESAGTNY